MSREQLPTHQPEQPEMTPEEADLPLTYGDLDLIEAAFRRAKRSISAKQEKELHSDEIASAESLLNDLNTL